jgi:hypothetical protein
VPGGEAQLADPIDQVVADRVGGLVAVGGVQATGEASVDDVGEDRERGVEVDGERDLGAERVEVERADLLGGFGSRSPSVGRSVRLAGWG